MKFIKLRKLAMNQRERTEEDIKLQEKEDRESDKANCLGECDEIFGIAKAFLAFCKRPDPGKIDYDELYNEMEDIRVTLNNLTRKYKVPGFY